LPTAGTGKTLVARALAAQACRAGRKVTFFMRKGADILSKWVGEAERVLRLLFAEAERCQPSIIFFDELDGLAPVRLSLLHAMSGHALTLSSTHVSRTPCGEVLLSVPSDSF
jgi:SpoVK/Ycf46/Vps4 family AAA+-type ATPase